MLGKYRDRTVPEVTPTEEIDRNLVAMTAALPGQIAEAYAKMELQQACTLPVELARAANGYIDATRPFSLAKDPAQSARLDTVLSLAAQATKNALVALLPVMPEKAQAGLAQLGVEIRGKTIAQLFEEKLAPGHRVNEGLPLFPKVA